MSKNDLIEMAAKLSLGQQSGLTPCACMGPQNGQPLCPCRMKSVQIVDGRYVLPSRDLGPATGIDALGKKDAA